MSSRQKLFSAKDPFDTEGTKELFLLAVKENCEFQYKNCPEYRAILESRGFCPEMLKSFSDIEKLPFIPTLFFKNHELKSVPENKILINATSSGTKGKFSKIGFDLNSLWLGLKMVLKIAKHEKLISLCPTNYIIFGYKPHKSNKTAVTKTAFGATLFAPAIKRVYAIKYDGEKYVPDIEGTVEAIMKFSCSKFPLRFMGFPSYTYFALKMMEERGINITLPKGSKIMLGGGWKQFYKEKVDKKTFYALANKVLGIDDKNIVEFFGAVEHPILYCDCRNHHFHVPVYSRVIIRDVKTLKPLPMGEIGLIELVSPMVRSAPVLSVITDDLGILHGGAECGCGIDSPYLEIVGRVGLKDIKTCAAGAAELLSKGDG